jgi:hypothetical protein
MTTNIILECRQSDTNSITKNGVYESYLADDVIINDGDILIMKNAYIDTRKESTINIDNDLTLTINYGVYFTDWLEDRKYKNQYFDSSGNNIFITGNTDFYNAGAVYKGQRFIPYVTQFGTADNLQTVQYVEYKALGVVFGEDWPDMPVVYEYVDPVSQQTVTVHKTIPASPAGTDYLDELNLLIKPGSFQIISPSLNEMQIKYYWKFIKTQINEEIVDVYSPYIFTKSFILPAGNYNPDDLALFISKKMSENDLVNNSTILNNNSFVKSVEQFKAGQPYPNGAVDASGNPLIIPVNAGSSIGTYYFSDDMTTRFFFNDTESDMPNYLIGATQTALEIDSDNNIFNWTYIHSPMYDETTGSNISTRIQNIGKFVHGTNPEIKSNYIKTSDNVGIFFTGLSAKTSDGKYFDFWSGVLGFDLSVLCVAPAKNFVTPPDTSYFGLTGSFYSYNIIPEQNITSGYSGIDSSIIKTPGKWNILQGISVPSPSDDDNVIHQAPAIFSTINNTTPLIASTSYIELLDDFSHFVIDANLHFINNYIGKEKYNNIQGTVSRYYQFGNYCVGDSEGSIQYQHRGTPLMLKSIKIRILRSDKTEDPNLGSDNTIIFQLIKSSK